MSYNPSVTLTYILPHLVSLSLQFVHYSGAIFTLRVLSDICSGYNFIFGMKVCLYPI